MPKQNKNPFADPNRYPTNPNYGSGIFRRRILLVGEPSKVVAELEDDCHGFRSTLFHDGEKVTGIETATLRAPLTTCSGASEPIKQLIDLPLSTSTFDIGQQVNPKANCTHLYDLTVLAMAHALRGNTTRRYDVDMNDEADTTSTVNVYCDKQLIHSWETQKFAILQPDTLAGNPMMKGFTRWATEHFSGVQLEAAFVLQKGYFVGQVRMYDIDQLDGQPVVDNTVMQGVCYSYAPEVVPNAYRTKNIRDFTDTPEQLLKFL